MKALSLVLLIAAIATAFTFEGRYNLRLDPDNEMAIYPPMLYLGIGEFVGQVNCTIGLGIRGGAEPGDVPGLSLSAGASFLTAESTLVYLQVSDIPTVNSRAGAYITAGFITRL